MKSMKLKDNLHWIGIQDHELRVFDIIMETQFGTSYNSYILKGDEKTVLFETVKVKFFDEYIQKLTEIVDIEDIDYLVVNHTEPDHAGSIEKLLELNPNIHIFCSAAAGDFLGEIANRDIFHTVINEEMIVDIGGMTLRFISAPFLHWPDSIYTYVKEKKLLFTCDSFGSHYAFDDVLLSKVTNNDDYMKALVYYYNMIFGPFKQHVLVALDKIKDLDIDMILVGHGPVLDCRIDEITSLYRKWSQEGLRPVNDVKRIAVPYVSAYGYTKELSEKIIEGILSAGEFHVESFDMVYASKAKVFEEIFKADGVLFGTPTINSDALKPIWDIVTSLSPIVHGEKVASAFGSYGWSGEGVPNIIDRLHQLRMKVYAPGLSIRFKPSNENLLAAFDFGASFAQAVITGQVPLSEKDEYKLVYDDGIVRLWKCIVCGEIFEGVNPPDKCPACGVGSEQFVEIPREEASFKSTEPGRIIIVGNQAAGLSAAMAARSRNKNIDIVMIGREKEKAYYRPMLSKSLYEDLVEEEFYLKSEKWYEDNNIQTIFGREVIGIEESQKKVVLDDASEMEYTSLILATGARCFVPPCEGFDLENVFTLRNLEDATNIKAAADGKKNALVVGGGVLGLEAAWQLRKLGLEVTVVELGNRIFPRQLDEEGAILFAKIMEEKQLGVILGSSVSSIVNTQTGLRATLSSGEKIDTDLVLISAGVRANVDNSMKTSKDGIYACGDCAALLGVNYSVWPQAQDQGKVAGANAVGDSLEYVNSVPSNFFHGMDTQIFSAGDLSDELTSFTVKSTQEGRYMKVKFSQGKAVGGILIGDVSKANTLLKGIEKNMPEKDMMKLMTK